MWISEKATKYFKEVNLAKSRKKLQLYISEDLECFVFLKSFQQLWLSEKVAKYLKKVNFAKSINKLQSYISENPKL